MFWLKTKVEIAEVATWRVLQKQSVLKNFAKFTEEQLLCRNLFLFNEVVGIKCLTLLKETPTWVFSSKYCQICKKTFFTKHLRATTFGRAQNNNT